MKVVIIILILIVIGFAVAIGVGVVRAVHPPSDNGGPRLTASGEIDEDALEHWQPPPVAALLGKLGAPFAPKLLKTAVEVSGRAGSGLESGRSGQLVAAPSNKDMRVARLRLMAGSAARATYACVAREGRTCPQVACVCSPGLSFDADAVDDCPEAWRKARTPPDSDRLQCRPKDDDAATLLVYPEGGVIKIEPLASQVATVQIR